jgi:hypothetical protein
VPSCSSVHDGATSRPDLRLSVGCEHPDDRWRDLNRPSPRDAALSPDHSERSTLAACIAHVAGASASDVPLDPDEQRAWLAERGLGLVPVVDAATFWPGPWIAHRPARDGSGPRAVVMFGVPSGAIWDPLTPPTRSSTGTSSRHWTSRHGHPALPAKQALASSRRWSSPRPVQQAPTGRIASRNPNG